ncbi:electron transport complex subunit E [Psychrobium sp. 1_MG-2023]|uniref:electron transport complex subunit E n=1 Tax=Psychrobium sp. 1_MG-2023 TaxID=3062624 RepID=UPI000C346377|nr:electron transport complex subunit E [Psychrobium sp. 1_MG-2023]MDP2562900.1 electron transport complex subunit E [Psychrobium sp. 1_MG-2023]PKF54041.1 electron transport complex subunit RsxE [Alteromonadales bacterium alter-6D02]
MNQYAELTWQGLWKNNPGLVQLLGLCPLLAVTSTVTNAIGMSLATIAVMIGSNATVSLIRTWIPKEIRIPIFVMIIAGFVTCVQLLFNAYAYGLYQSLGIFLPLIVTNCIIIGRAEAYASKNTLLPSVYDGFIMGIGFSLVLIILGAIREVLGQGTLFDGAELLLGEWASSLRVEVMQLDHSFLFIMLPPGAFVALGFILAAKNSLNSRMESLVEPQIEADKPQRVRINKVS